MNVGVDVAPLVLDTAGTARYVNGLVAGLEDRDDVQVHRLSFGGPGRLAALVRDVAWYPVGLPAQARRLDVLHCTTFRAPLRASVPVVVTVHDVAVLRYPELFTAWTRAYARTLLRPVLRAATRILAVSEFTKREVSELVGVRPERIDVAYNAASTDVFRPDGPRAEGDYVLAVGTLEPRKNLARLIEATRSLGLELRIAGSRGWGAVDVDARHVRWLGRPDDAELAVLLRGARCLAYPSLYEGFGIPVLGGDALRHARRDERRKCDGGGRRRRGGARRSIRSGGDRGRDRAAYSHRDRLIAAGLERARCFGWPATAASAVAAYREAAA